MKILHVFRLVTVLALLTTSFLGGTTPPAPEMPEEHPAIQVFLNPINDPLVSVNRAMESFNSVMVRYVVYPLGYAYNKVVPECVQDGISNVGHNLLFPLRLVTNLLQGKLGNAWEETERFGINTTVGILGWNDQATEWGIFRHDEDFGQTLAVWGVGTGWYLNLPFVGPSNVRDTLTLIPDLLLTPHTYLPGVGSIFLGNSLFANSAFLNNYFDSHNSTYPLTRAAYTLARENLIKDSQFQPVPRTAPDQSLGVLKLIPKKRDFYTFRKTREINLPGGRIPLPFSLYTQDVPDGRLLFILPGLSSTRDNPDMIALAELFHDHGWTVAIISSTFTPEFFSATDTPLPGLIPRDCKNLDLALTKIRDQIFKHEYSPKQRIGLTPKVAVFGVSLGAINTLYLAARDFQGKSTLNAQRFIAVNPPREPLAALDKLDQCFDIPLKWPAETRTELVRQTIQKITGTILYEDSCPDPQLNFEESRFLIGLNCRLGLLEVMRAIANSPSKKCLENIIDISDDDALDIHALRLSYRDYLEKVMMPFAKQHEFIPAHATTASLAQSVRMDALAPNLIQNPKVRLFHTKNDFLIKPEDLTWYQQILPQRCFILPQGGHLGQLIDPRVQQSLLRVAQ